MKSYVLAATNTPLAANAAFVTNWIRISGADALDTLTLPPVIHEKLYVVGYTYSDQPSAALGFQVQYSLDGSTVGPGIRDAQVGDEYITFRSLVRGKYVRISYTNGATPQTSFELYARLVSE